MDKAKTYSSAAAAGRDFFGGKDGGNITAQEWMAEWRELNDNDKKEILDGLRSIGYTIELKS